MPYQGCSGSDGHTGYALNLPCASFRSCCQSSRRFKYVLSALTARSSRFPIGGNSTMPVERVTNSSLSSPGIALDSTPLSVFSALSLWRPASGSRTRDDHHPLGRIEMQSAADRTYHQDLLLTCHRWSGIAFSKARNESSDNVSAWPSVFKSRGDRIRTCDLVLPKLWLLVRHKTLGRS